MSRKFVKKVLKSRNKVVDEVLTDPLISNTILRDLESLLLKTYQRGYTAGYNKASRKRGDK